MARTAFRVMVCELPDDLDFTDSWERLTAMMSSDRPDLVVLPELPFSNWFCAEQESVQSLWEEAVRAHLEFVERIVSSSTAIVYSVPADRPEGRRNVACVAGAGLDHETHSKRHLPDEEGYWEARWYDAGSEDPDPVATGLARTGVQLCTEMWKFDTARRLGAQGADVIAVPRTTPLTSRDRWICGGRAAAISAGAYCLSSNRSGPGPKGEFGGAGWIIDPDGEVLAVTSRGCPIVTCEIDLEMSRTAKATYPRYALKP